MRSESTLELFDEKAIYRLLEAYPDLPESYIQVLREVGAGTIGTSSFRIYGGPIEADDIFDDSTAKGLKNFLFLGDDYSGWMIAYDTEAKPWRIRLFDHEQPTEIEPDDPCDLAEFLCRELSRS